MADFDFHSMERARLAARLAELDAEYQARPVYWTRSMLRDPATFQANRQAIVDAQRGDRILADGAPLPDGGRWFGAEPARPPRRYNVAELRDPAFFAANREGILKAQREGRIDGLAERSMQRRTP